jgi:hypothetical protein
MKRMRRRATRDGFSFLELEVSLVLLGIALAGLVPLGVMQSKQIKNLESRLDHRSTYYLAPSSNVWARKLGAGATIETEQPGTAPSSEPEKHYALTVLALTKSLTSETVSVRVQAEEIPE